ncbi:DUF393 domain-containing protein [Kocuria sp.]|uniref:thiol-disulfide oxidoreductase DCC family protein n=1 Tax=Kocuria sp. TaxID=1871328 RepID=UPI0028AEB458|nr:DUF393 domain-containing protein [Kocuria sp.]
MNPRGTEQGTSLHLVFDGNCGFCTRCVGWARTLDRHDRIALHAYQVPGVLERFGLTNAEGNASVWAVLSRSGERSSGAHAVAVTLDTALGIRVFEPFYRLPPVRWVQDRVYRWVADHRGKFPGVTPWCQQHPGQCGTP